MNKPTDDGIQSLNSLLGEVEMPKIVTWEDGRSYYIIYIRVMDWPVEVDKAIPVDCEIAQEIFEDYVIHGWNMTGREIQKQYGFTGKAWLAFKHAMNLVKTSLPIHYDRIQELTEIEIEEELDRIVEEGVDTRVGRKMDRANERKKNLMLEQMARKLQLTEQWWKDIMEQWNDYIGEPKVRPKMSQAKNKASVTFILSDPHFGNENTADTERRLLRAEMFLLNHPAKRINIIMAGDHWEDFSPWYWSHAQTKMKMDARFREPQELIMYIADLYTWFLTHLAEKKEVCVRAVSGNHDRVTCKNDEDERRLAWFFIMQLLERSLPDKISFEYYEESIQSFVLSGVEYLLMHWDRRLGNLKPAVLASQYREHGKKPLNIIRGHKHSPSLGIEAGEIQDIRVGAFSKPWNYEVREGFTTKGAEPMVTIIEHDDKWNQDIIFKKI